MKQCPACKTTYTDDSLKFCLSDGTSLISAEEEETVVRKPGNDPLRIDFSAAPEQTSIVRQEPASNTSAKWIKILIAAMVLGMIALAALGLAGVAFYYGTGERASELPQKTPLPTPVPTSTLDAEKERLKDEIANIQKQLDEQKKKANTPDTDNELGSPVTATVNSPNDGFLALRSLPDADRGERLEKIPEGAEVEILNCEKTAVTIGGRNGRWCQVDYNGQIGWVFDAWLDY